MGLFTCITGVSGSGKSTLVLEVLSHTLSQPLYHKKPKIDGCKELRGVDALDKVIEIDQSPIGRTPRSNPATYTGLFASIRDLFAKPPESRVRGYKPGRFSFNVKGGRCEACQGDGLNKIEMHFLPDVYVTCEVCKGQRYNRETLEIKYKGRSIADVLNMTVDEALGFFENIPLHRDEAGDAARCGAGLFAAGTIVDDAFGRRSATGQAPRNCAKRPPAERSTFWMNRRPACISTTSSGLLDVLQRLVDRGNTVLVIEHNLDVIKNADWIIDLGPEGGDRGGESWPQARRKKSPNRSDRIQGRC